MHIQTQENKQHLILPEYIDSPHLQDKVQRGVFGVINALGWMLWIYLFIPLLSLLAWVFGYYQFDQYILNDPQPDLVNQLWSLAILVLVMNVVLLIWASYNWWRFKNNDRRQHVENISNQQIAHFYELSEDALQLAQREQIVTFYYDDIGKITDIQ
jgi:biofilm PGA synthesis protein PgaD